MRYKILSSKLSTPM